MRVMFNYVMATKKFDVDGMEDVKEMHLCQEFKLISNLEFINFKKGS